MSVKPVGDVEPGRDPWESARYANTIASATVSKTDLESKAACIRETQSKLDCSVNN